MRLLQPLRVRRIALLWGGLSTSAVGDQLGLVAITWIAVDAFGAAAGYLTALQAFMTLLAALLIGRWTDGRNERKVMIAADAGRSAALVAVVALWEATGQTSAAALIGLVVILAIGQAAFRPAVQIIMPGLAPCTAMLPAINALLDGTERLARLAGPGLIALAAAWLPVMHFLTLDAISFVASATALAAIGPRPTRSARVHSPLGVTVLRGFRAMRCHPLLGFLLHTSGINNGAWYAAMFLGVPLLLAHTGQTGAGGVRAFGAVIACYGLTNLAANLVVGGRGLPAAPGRLIFCGNILTGAGIVLIGASALLPGVPAWAIYVGAALAGSGGPMNDIPRSTLMQTVPAPADVAAVFRAWIVMANAGLLVGMAAAPTLFAILGAAAGVMLFGAVMVITGIIGLLRRIDTRLPSDGRAAPAARVATEL